MAYTTFGSISTGSGVGNLDIIQQSVRVHPAQPKTNLVNLPGADGDIDLTEALGLGVKYASRKIEWTFALYPSQDWATKRTEVANAINGKRLAIVLSEDSTHTYNGRVTVKDYARDKELRQITVEAICDPFGLLAASTVNVSLTTSYQSKSITTKGRPIVPTFTTDVAADVQYGGVTYTLPVGTSQIPQIVLPQNTTSTIKVRGQMSSGSMTIQYQNGDL